MRPRLNWIGVDSASTSPWENDYIQKIGLRNNIKRLTFQIVLPLKAQTKNQNRVRTLKSCDLAKDINRILRYEYSIILLYVGFCWIVCY